MMIVVSYDINIESEGGQKRLRRVAKTCQNFGQRVQNSVFECLVDTGQLKILQYKLQDIIDPEKDSLRFYYLGNSWTTRVQHFGAKKVVNMDDTLIL